MYYIYILRCRDNSLYTGITTDIDRRFAEHRSKSAKGAKYTRFHEPLSVAALWTAQSRAAASKLEYFLKTLTKAQKEQLIQSPYLLVLLYGNRLSDKNYACVMNCSSSLKQ